MTKHTVKIMATTAQPTTLAAVNQRDTLQELWAVKDATAARFESAAAYFEHLSHIAPKRANRASPRASARKPFYA
jgi:hypothetical protein